MSALFLPPLPWPCEVPQIAAQRLRAEGVARVQPVILREGLGALSQWREFAQPLGEAVRPHTQALSQRYLA